MFSESGRGQLVTALLVSLQTVITIATVATLLSSCGGEFETRDEAAAAQNVTCMKCHNGTKGADYSGPGIENPHHIGTRSVLCTECHGGDGTADDR